MQVGGVQNGSTGLASAVSKVSITYFDPRDTNQDGIVSAAEELAYSLQHPEMTAQIAPINQYTQIGTLSAVGQTSNSSLNLYA